MIEGIKTENGSCALTTPLLRVISVTLMLGLESLDVAHLWTKFDHSIFSCSRDMLDALQNLNGSCNLTTALSGTVCHPGLAHAMINLSTKFEVSISTCYKDMQGDAKY